MIILSNHLTCEHISVALSDIWTFVWSEYLYQVTWCFCDLILHMMDNTMQLLGTDMCDVGIIYRYRYHTILFYIRSLNTMYFTLWPTWSSRRSLMCDVCFIWYHKTWYHKTSYSILNLKICEIYLQHSTIHKLTSSKKTWWQSVIEIYDLFIKILIFIFMDWRGYLQLVFLKPKIHLVFFKGCFGARVEVKLIRKRAEGVTAVSWD